MNRVSFLVDGFNLYHSVRTAERDLGKSTRWLDLHSLCVSYIYLFGREARLHEIDYFSALARHLEASNPDVTARHRKLIKALRTTGVNVHLSRFKKKTIRCDHCGKRFSRYEEKETDVAIAVRLLELLATDSCDTVVIMSGDTDMAPAFRTASRLYPSKRIVFAFPYRRKNKELAQLAAGSFTIDGAQYVKHQLPDPYVLPSGIELHKPSKW